MLEITENKKETIFDRKSLLQRDFHLTLSDYDNFTIKSINANPGDSLLDKGFVATIICSRTKIDNGNSVIERVEREYAFNHKTTNIATLDHYVIEEGQVLEPGVHLILRYVAEDCFQQLINNAIISLSKVKSDIYAAPNIPQKKIDNAIKAYAQSVDPERVLFLYDGTIFGSAKDGYIVTDSAFYYKDLGTPFSFRFNQVTSHKIIEITKKNADKVELETALQIQLNDERTITLEDQLYDFDIFEFSKFLDVVGWLNQEGMTKSTDGYVIVEDMPEPVKINYAKLLVWLTYMGDNTIDERELSELQVLMTQLKFNAELRQETRAAIHTPTSLTPQSLLEDMMAQAPSGSEFALKVSLLKDGIRIHRAASKTSAVGAQPILVFAELLGLGETQLAFLDEACQQDEKILSGEISDEQLIATLKDFSARASAIGIPMAAVYLSGSVTGLSAAGITSGLASLGLGGVLGLSSMVTGIGVVILLGVGAYQGIKWLGGGSQRDKAGRRELLLQEVMRVHQKAISNMAEDIAFFGQRLVGLIEDVEKNKLLIANMSREMNMFANALKNLRAREANYEQNYQDEIRAKAA